MVVVADTSPINYLVLIYQIDILPRLYTRILIPPSVLIELKHPAAPGPVRGWAVQPPGWLEVLAPKNSVSVPQLDLGESEAIALATEMDADVLIVDEQAARQEAARRGLRVAGTLSVLDDADQAGLLDFDMAVARLRQTSFRVSQAVLAEIKTKRSRRVNPASGP
jgi:predicted nucleic acid-binding protein